MRAGMFGGLRAEWIVATYGMTDLRDGQMDTPGQRKARTVVGQQGEDPVRAFSDAVNGVKLFLMLDALPAGRESFGISR